MYCLVANGETSVAPQYDIGKGWSRPDFVAVRPPKKQIYVVEVSAAGNLTDLVEKVRAREKQWLSQLRPHLEHLNLAAPDWSYRILTFIRRDQIGWFSQSLGHQKD